MNLSPRAQDWWNATTIEGYWRSWNMPVHRWMVRHIYFPIIRRGHSKGLAMTVVFFLSAVFHEVRRPTAQSHHRAKKK